MRIADEIASDYLSHSIDIQRFSESVRLEVLGYLKKLEIELVSLLTNEDIRTLSVRTRLTTLLRDVQGSIGNSFTGIQTEVYNYMIEVGSLEFEGFKKTINRNIGLALSLSGLNPEFIKSLASNVLIDGAPSKEWWGRQEEKLKQRFSDQVRLGIGAGESSSDIVRRIRGTSTGRRIGYLTKAGKLAYHTEFVGGVMTTTTRDAASLVLTSMQAISNAARAETYQNNSNVLKGSQALVTLDGKTTPLCQGRSGNSWDLSGKPINGTLEPYPGHPPWHWRCRSTLIPILKSFDELLSGKLSNKQKQQLRTKTFKSTQASMDGQVAGDLNYNDWLKTKDTAFQKQVLGRTKYKLWKDNDISLSEMVDQKGNPLSIRRLKQKYLKNS